MTEAPTNDKNSLKHREEADLAIALDQLTPDALAEFHTVANDIPEWRVDLLIELAWTLYGQAIIGDDELDPIPKSHQHLDTVGRWYGLLLRVDHTDYEQMAAIRTTYLRELRLVHDLVEQGMDEDKAWNRVTLGTAFGHAVMYSAIAIESERRVRKPKIPRLRLHRGGKPS